MSITKGSFSGQPFSLLLDADTLEEVLRDGWFRPPLSPAVKEAQGFCMLEDPMEAWSETVRGQTTFSSGDVLIGWRKDQKKIDKPTFNALLKVRLEQWKKENGRDRVPLSIKEEFKETLTLDMLLKTDWKMKVIEMAFVEVGEGRFRLWIGSKNEAVITMIQKAFSRAAVRVRPDGLFGFTKDVTTSMQQVFATPWTPMGWTTPIGVSGADPEEPMMPASRAVPGFYAWLLLRSGKVDLPDGESVELYAETEVILTDAESPQVLVRLDDIQGSMELAVALQKGRSPVSMGLFMRRDDREYHLRLEEGTWVPSAVKLPTQVKTGEAEEVWLDRKFLLDELLYLMGRLVEIYMGEVIEDREGLNRDWKVFLDGFSEA